MTLLRERLADPRLAALFPTDGEARERRLGALTEPAAVLAEARAWAARAGGHPDRVAVSLWSKYWFRAVLTPVCLADVLGVRLDLEQVGLVIRDDEPAALTGLTGRAGLPRDPATALGPWVAAMAAAARLSPRVFWSNAGNFLEAAGDVVLTLDPGWLPRVERQRALWFGRRRVAGAPNPLFQPVRWEAGAPPRRRRRLCCLRYVGGDLAYCSNCPLLDYESGLALAEREQRGSG